MRLSFGVQNVAGIEAGIRRLASAVRWILDASPRQPVLQSQSESAAVKPESDGWRPSCSTQMLHVRAEVLRSIRQFFRDREYLEVETPCLSRDIVLDAWLEPFSIDVRGDQWFLQTSPEAHMKRLLAADVGSIFQISRVFRQHERGNHHNSEFTMIEWYGVGSNWKEQLEVTESLVRTATAAAAGVTGRNIAEQWSR